MALTSTHQVFEKTFTPTPEGGAYALPATVMLAVDPTVQVAGDVETPVAGHWLKSIGEQTKDLLNSTVEEIKTEFRNKVQVNFDEIEGQIDQMIAEQLDPVDDATTIAELEHLRDNQLPTIIEQIVNETYALVFNRFQHDAKVALRDGSKARQLLDAVDGLSITGTIEQFDVTLTANAGLFDEDLWRQVIDTRSADPLRDKLSKPSEIYSDLQIEVSRWYNTESYVKGALGVRNLASD